MNPGSGFSADGHDARGIGPSSIGPNGIPLAAEAISDELAFRFMDDTRALRALSKPEQDAMIQATSRAYDRWTEQASVAQQQWADRDRRDFDALKTAMELAAEERGR
jgi:hypothetical protein